MFVEHKEQGEPSRENGLSPMKLSEAIRLGSKISVQCRENLFMNGAACALGAAVLGLGLTPKDGPFRGRWFVEKFGIPMRMVNDIIYRNDGEKWTREGIANWLERKGY